LIVRITPGIFVVEAGRSIKFDSTCEGAVAVRPAAACPPLRSDRNRSDG